MTSRRTIAGLAILALAAGWTKAEPPPTNNVGYQVLDLKLAKDQKLTVAVWYPTKARPKKHTYGGPTTGNVAVDAPPDAGPYPLLVFSHGYGGGGLSAVFFTEALAARGWIVVCPDHHDQDSLSRIREPRVSATSRMAFLRSAKAISNSTPDDREKYLYRLDEMKAALNGILANKRMGKLIDKERIAVGGHSFGGYTALGLSGTIKERFDSRIKALLLFSTGAGGYLYKESELASVRVPTMLFMGEKEAKQKRGKHSMPELEEKIYAAMPAPKYFLVVRGAGHFSFNNAFGDTAGAKLMSGSAAQFDVIRRYAIAFLETHVAGRVDKTLERPDPMLTRYDKETTASR